jgi:hypothetical protein
VEWSDFKHCFWNTTLHFGLNREYAKHVWIGLHSKPSSTVKIANFHRYRLIVRFGVFQITKNSEILKILIFFFNFSIFYKYSLPKLYSFLGRNEASLCAPLDASNYLTFIKAHFKKKGSIEIVPLSVFPSVCSLFFRHLYT